MPGRLRNRPQLPERDQVEVSGKVISFIIVRSSARERTMALSVTSEGEAKVAVPARTPHDAVRGFVAAKAGWIAKRQALIAAKPPPDALATGSRLPFFGDELTLVLVRVGGRRGTANRKGATLEVQVPAALPEEELDDWVSELLKLWYRLRADEHLRKRVAFWAPRIGREPGAIHVRDQKRLWGSCSPTGALRFNFRLAMVHPDLADYVIVHELAHLVEGNHGPKFWAVVEGVLPDHKNRRAQLRGLTEKLPL